MGRQRRCRASRPFECGPPSLTLRMREQTFSWRKAAQIGTARCAVAAQFQLRRQDLIDSGRMPGVTSSDHVELVAARKRIAELETELAVTQRANELLCPPKAVCSHRSDGRRGYASQR